MLDAEKFKSFVIQCYNSCWMDITLYIIVIIDKKLKQSIKIKVCFSKCFEKRLKILALF